MNLKKLKNKELLILGIGREGADSFAFFRKIFPKKTLAIADQKTLSTLDDSLKKTFEKDKNIKLILGKNYLAYLKNYDVIVKSPGIKYEKIKKFLKKSALVTSQTQLFFENCPAKIIGITGTKGKSTTSSLIYHLLKTNKLRAYLLGNIEVPSLSFLLKIKKEDYIVYELSSHQLQFLEKSPNLAIFLNIYPEHLDYYQSFKQYFQAKANIARYQKKADYFIFNPKFSLIKNLAQKSKAKKILIDSEKIKKIINQNKFLEKITHPDNLSAVFETAKILKISLEKTIKGLKSFKPLEHRLEFVGQYQKIKFYDDSIATIPEATIFALDSLGESVETLIAGGFDRGIEFTKISKKIPKTKIKNLILFPSSGQKIWAGIPIEQKKKLNRFFVNDMASAIKIAFEKTSPNKICLLSCASPSFGIFKDFKERGDQFKKFVKQYGS